MTVHSTLGKHVLADAWGVKFNKLNNLEELKKVMVESVKRSGANVVSIQEKQFEPNGVTILLLLSESHFSIHTYPEEGYAGIDCYTCGETVEPLYAIDYLLHYLQPKRSFIKGLSRGTEKGIVSMGGSISSE